MRTILPVKKISLFLSFIAVLAAFILITKYYEFQDEEALREPERSIAGEKDDPFAAARFRFEMIAGKNKSIDPVWRIRALEHTALFNMQRNVLKKTSTISGWSALGPGNIGGRIRSIIVNPADGLQIVIGAVSGGVWKTTTGGTTWSPTMDAQTQIAIDCMVADPSNSNILYAGTGEGWGNVDAVYGGGIYKSTDFGSTWSMLASTVTAGWNFKNVLKLAFDPSGNLYAVTKAFNYTGGVGGYFTNGGLYKSTDGGSTWTKINSSSTNYYNGCDVLPISSSTILFATSGGGIFKTTDGGTSWTQMTTGLPTANSRIVLSKDPGSASIYAVFASTSMITPDFGLIGIYKSTDNGSVWTALTKPSNLASTANLSYLGTQGWYDNVIAVDPSNSSNIYVGGVDMMKSTDAGTTWSHLTYWNSAYGTPVVHADHHAIAFDPVSSNIVYSGNDGGIYKSTNGGTTWTSLNSNLAITQFYGGAVSSTGNNYQGGTQDNGHLYYTGSSTDWNMVYGGDGGYAAIDQSAPAVSYEEYVYLDMSKSTDNGTTWNSCITGLADAGNSSLCLFIAPFSMNPENSAVLIAGSDKIWLTTNSAGSWTKVSNTLVASNKVSAVTIVNNTSPYLAFAGTTNGQIFVCTSLAIANGTSNVWTDITPAGNNGAWVRRITVNTASTQNIYACYSGYNNDAAPPYLRHIYYSSNQGTSWTDKSGNLPDVPVHSLVIDNTTSSTLYIGTETGVYQTVDGGTTWNLTASGMPSSVPVDQLVRQTGTDNLFAFTHGRGVFVTNAPLPVELTSFAATLVETNALLKWSTATEMNNYGFNVERRTAPNPYSDSSDWEKIGFVLGSGTVNIAHEYSYMDRELSPGQYVYRIQQLSNDGTFKYYGSDEIKVSPPEKYSLDQNYPNPFNPATTIRYSLPEPAHVRLEIFNTSGQLIAKLLDGRENSGQHEVEWNAGAFASGIYYYRLTADRYVQTRKLMLLK